MLRIFHIFLLESFALSISESILLHLQERNSHPSIMKERILSNLLGPAVHELNELIKKMLGIGWRDEERQLTKRYKR